MSVDAWREVLDTNATSAFATVQAAAGVMDGHGGSITSTRSRRGWSGVTGWSKRGPMESRGGSAPHPEWSLVGTTTAPPFDWAHFRLGDRADLVDRYPDARMRIEELIRPVSRSAAPGCSGR